MLPVVPHAQPTKFMPALATGHVHAPRILLNVHLALGTLLAVQFLPNFDLIFHALNLI